jgi:hypothetical protein
VKTYDKYFRFLPFVGREPHVKKYTYFGGEVQPEVEIVAVCSSPEAAVAACRLLSGKAFTMKGYYAPSDFPGVCES